MEEANPQCTRQTQQIVLPQTLRLAMACNDASDASTLIAMQSHYHPVVGRSQTKGERRKLAGQERGKHGHVLEKCYIGFCTPTHTNGF